MRLGCARGHSARSLHGAAQARQVAAVHVPQSAVGDLREQLLDMSRLVGERGVDVSGFCGRGAAYVRDHQRGTSPREKRDEEGGGKDGADGSLESTTPTTSENCDEQDIPLSQRLSRRADGCLGER